MAAVVALPAQDAAFAWQGWAALGGPPYAIEGSPGRRNRRAYTLDQNIMELQGLIEHTLVPELLTHLTTQTKRCTAGRGNRNRLPALVQLNLGPLQAFKPHTVAFRQHDIRVNQLLAVRASGHCWTDEAIDWLAVLGVPPNIVYPH